MMVDNKFPPLLKLLAVPAEKRNAFWKMACVDVNCFGLSNRFPSSVPTGDGRNLANQLISRIYHHSHDFIHLRWLFGISGPSTVPVMMFVKLHQHHFSIISTQLSQASNFSSSGFSSKTCSAKNPEAFFNQLM